MIPKERVGSRDNNKQKNIWNIVAYLDTHAL